MNDSRKGFLRADPDAPATPSSHEMRRAALRKARESAAQRSAASAYEARHANEHLKRQLQELRKELLQRDAAIGKLERMLAHAEERVRHNYEVAERRGKVIDVMLKGLEAVSALISDSTGVYGLHLNNDLAAWESLRTGGRYEEWLVAFDEALARAKEEGL